MKKLLFALLILAITAPAFAKTTRVKGYFKKNGAYVKPHLKTTPDGSKMNNFSAKGNTNPYTGEKGSADPLKK